MTKHKTSMLIIGIVAIIAVIGIVFMINSSMKAQVARDMPAGVKVINPQRSVYGQYGQEPVTSTPREINTIQQWPAWEQPESYYPEEKR